MEKKKIFITTPIYYPNNNLHIGHAYTTVVADYLARYKKLLGYEVYFLTGSDEHGQKIFDSATLAKKTPKVYVNEIVKTFKKLWNLLGVEYTNFLRTSDSKHEIFVQKIITTLYEKNYIYKGVYSGWYCKFDEAYYTKNQLKNGMCPACGREVKELSEDAYFLKLAPFKDWIKYELINNKVLIPEIRTRELIRSFINDLQDLSISRKNLLWGIPIPFDKEFSIYVWIDALLNYLSTFEYKVNDWTLESVWKKDSSVEIIQFVGKEITRFHAIYWPIILKMLGYRKPLIIAHGWLITDTGDKMSKSKGNALDPVYLIKKYSRDALRFFLVNNLFSFEDSKFSEALFIEAINKILVNKYSNLINRTDVMVQKYFKGIVPTKGIKTTMEKKVKAKLNNLLIEHEEFIQKHTYSLALKTVLKYADVLNNYIEQAKPWEINLKRKETVLNFLITECFNLSLLLSPVLIDSFIKIKNWLNLNEVISIKSINRDFANIKLNKIDFLFKRISN